MIGEQLEECIEDQYVDKIEKEFLLIEGTEITLRQIKLEYFQSEITIIKIIGNIEIYDFNFNCNRFYK